MPEEIEDNDYKKFFEETPVALIRTCLKTGRFLMANKFAVELFGHTSFEDLQSSCKITDFYSIEDRKKVIQQIKRHGLIENYEIKFRIADKPIWVSARLRINCGDSCIEGSLIDITSVVEMREVYLDSLKEVGKKLDKKIASLT